MDMPVQSLIKKEKLYAAVIFGWLVYQSTPAVAQRQRELKGTRGTYCVGPVIREKTAKSILQCTGKCSSDATCVTYIPCNSKCLLHAGFCSSSDLLPEPGSLYADEYICDFACNCINDITCGSLHSLYIWEITAANARLKCFQVG